MKICNGISFVGCTGTLQECKEEYKFCKEQTKSFHKYQWTIEQVTERIVEVEKEEA
jgi:hypothetical protein